MIWGDTVQLPEVQTAGPEVCVEFDTDLEAAAASRRKVLDVAATERPFVTGMHLNFPGFTLLVRSGTGYRLIPLHGGRPSDAGAGSPRPTGLPP